MKQDLWSRIRGARIARIIAVYLGASWVVLQIAELLQDALALPDWVLPVAVVLLLVGLVVITATAWVQSHPLTDSREESGEVPGDWEIAPADLTRAVREGRLPHLTWGRAVTGGALALFVLFGGAGALVYFGGGERLSVLGPAEAGAEDAAAGVAVLPFSVTGDGMEVYREGMVELVSTNLDGVSGLRAIDSRTVLSRWQRAFGDEEDIPLDQALQVASATGARYALIGNGLSTGTQVRFSADLYDLVSGKKIGSGRTEGHPEEVLALIDRLSVQSLRELLRAGGGQTVTDIQRLESVVTASIPALTSYLEGEALFRRARFREARGAFERAVAEDSTFALAWWRLGETYGWIDNAFADGSVENKARALRFMDRVPPREATLLQAGAEVPLGTVEHLEAVRRHTTSFPDDPEGWYLLGEYYGHSGVSSHPTDEEYLAAIRKALELDPGFSPYYSHVLRADVGTGDSVSFHRHLAALEKLNPEEAAAARAVWDFYRGGTEERARVRAVLDTLNERDLFVDFLTEAPVWTDDLYDEADEVMDILRTRGVDHPAITTWEAGILTSRGRLAELEARATAPGSPPQLERWLVEARALFDLPANDAVRRIVESSASTACVEPIDCLLRSWRDISARAAAGEPSAYGQGVERITRVLEPMMAEADDDFRARWDTNVRYLRGRAALERGDAVEALRILRDGMRRAGTGSTGHLYTVALGDAALAVGRPRDAARYFEAAGRMPFFRAYSRYRLGEVYELLGETDNARRAYESFLSLWSEADPGLPHPARARAALERIGS